MRPLIPPVLLINPSSNMPDDDLAVWAHGFSVDGYAAAFAKWAYDQAFPSYGTLIYLVRMAPGYVTLSHHKITDAQMSLPAIIAPR